MDAVTESEDLEALFERISSERASAPPAPPAAPDEAPAAERPVVRPGNSGEPAGGDPVASEMFVRVGQLTRKLHDALRELGYDKDLDAAVGKLPDARARLSYIAKLTGAAAEKAISKAEAGCALQQSVESEARALALAWEDVFAGRLDAGGFKSHAEATRDFLARLPERTSQSAALFTDIMLAQDFHDLTGQVIHKVMAIAETIEGQLVKLLLESTPPDKRVEVDPTWLNGPAIDRERPDVVADQGQVDDLLASLGF